MVRRLHSTRGGLCVGTRKGYLKPRGLPRGSSTWPICDSVSWSCWLSPLQFGCTK